MIWLPPCSATVSTTTVLAGLLHGARHGDLLLGHAHAAELDGEALQRARVAAGGGHVGARHLRHPVEAVEDVARQADLLGELVVDVDRVEVARGAGVPVRQVLVRRDLQLGDLIALGHTPLTMLVQVPRTTSSPFWLVETDSNT